MWSTTSQQPPCCLGEGKKEREEGKKRGRRGAWGGGLGRGCVSFRDLALEITHCHFFRVLLIEAVARPAEVWVASH